MAEAVLVSNSSRSGELQNQWHERRAQTLLRRRAAGVIPRIVGDRINGTDDRIDGSGHTRADDCESVEYLLAA
ncbi:hypothetical protein AB2L57_18235 (plasmid) [Microbacterium sp. HA-8]|uniref:hypothetical protein n=1 Tax=Microbacterium sp. HA-8 TaxID=3234200 RepID=UPI0038F6E1BF